MSNMKTLFLLLNLVFVSLSFSQNEKHNRDSFKLEIVADSINNYSMNVEASPYFIKDKMLQIYPSEKIFIEVELKKDTVYTMKVVKNNLNPEKTLEIEFVQNAKDRSEIISKLTLKNPFDKKLEYKAIMYTPTNDYWKPTSTIPVRPKLMTFETWPHAIITLVLNDWTFNNE